MTELVVWGLGADSRIYGSLPASTPEVEEAAMHYILTYPNHPIALGLADCLMELLIEGAIELLFGFIELP